MLNFGLLFRESLLAQIIGLHSLKKSNHFRIPSKWIVCSRYSSRYNIEFLCVPALKDHFRQTHLQRWILNEPDRIRIPTRDTTYVSTTSSFMSYTRSPWAPIVVFITLYSAISRCGPGDPGYIALRSFQYIMQQFPKGKRYNFNNTPCIFHSVLYQHIHSSRRHSL